MSAKNKKIIIAAAVFAVILIAAVGVYFLTRPETDAGVKTVTIEVVNENAGNETFTLRTYAEYLGEALLEEGLAEGESGDYGLFIKTVNGYTVDDAAQEWWCVTKGGETVNTGADQTPIYDGDTFELTMTVGYGG